jgi:hypothetical protein
VVVAGPTAGRTSRRGIHSFWSIPVLRKDERAGLMKCKSRPIAPALDRGSIGRILVCDMPERND